MLGVLNVGAGDTKITFDPKKPKELEEAKRKVREMLKRGYAILVDIGEGTYRRIKEFDEATCEYIVADFEAAGVDLQEVGDGKEKPGTKIAAVGGKGGKKERRLPAASTRGVAVARTAGG